MSRPLNGKGSDTDLLQCPYEVSHMILRKRFQTHLVKCRKSHPTAEKVTCPFNVSHRVNKVELEWHVATCNERQYFENFCNSNPSIAGLSSSMNRTFCGSESGGQSISFNTGQDITFMGGEYYEEDPSELWDTEDDVPTYNPSEYAANSEVLRMPVGLTPSQRAAFRLAERKRLQSFLK